MLPTINTILVPQGAEYKAICNRLQNVDHKPKVLSIPAGSKALKKYLQNRQWQQDSQVLVMGLCGGLNPGYNVGDVVLYESCVDQESGLIWECDGAERPLYCDRILTQQLYSCLLEKVSVVKALTSDSVVCLKAEKRRLGETSGALVVDMEGFVILNFFRQLGIPVAMLRVVSDDCEYDLPDISQVINSNGSVKVLSLIMTMLQQPLAATRLIRGGLRGLQVLKEITTLIFS